jgi:hypothetical protein
MRVPVHVSWFHSLAGVMVASILFNAAGASQPAMMIPMVAGATTVAGGAAARGGIEICSTGAAPDAQFRRLRFDEQRDELIATTNRGTTVTVRLDSAELSELSNAASVSTDGCIEVSIDPLADGNEEAFDRDLAASPGIVRTLLNADQQIAAFLDGGYGTMSLPSGIETPSAASQRLLVESTGYQALARRYTFAPISWHETRVTANALAGPEPAVTLTIDPRPLTMTPDGRRMAISDSGEKAAAVAPYQSLIASFTARVDVFAAQVDGLSDALRYAHAFAVLHTCRTADRSCAEDVKGFVRPAAAASEDSAFAELLSLIRNQSALTARSLRVSHLQAAWRNYRVGLDVRSLPPAERIAVFTDEAVSQYGDRQRAEALALGSGLDPNRLLSWIDGLDLSDQEFGGWAELGRFIVGVWAGKPLQELNDALERASTWARIKQDPALQYETLKAARDLTPLMAANLFVQERDGVTSPRIATTLGISSDDRQQTMDSDAYLSHLSRFAGESLSRYAHDQYDRLRARVAGLTDGAGRSTVNVADALTLLNDLARSRLLREHSLLAPGAVRRLEAEVNYLIAAAAFVEHDVEEASSRLRLVNTAIRAAQRDDESDLERLQTLAAAMERQIEGADVRKRR